MKTLPILLAVLVVAWTPCDAAGAPAAPAGAPAPARKMTRSFAPPRRINYREPRREYEEHSASGWKVFVESDLAEEHADLAGEALRRLETKLGELLDLLPPPSRGHLQQVPIFLMLGEESNADGRDNGGEDFQHHAPQHYPLLDPRWGGGLVIYSARNYVWLTDDWALRMLLHEFGHAWQLEQWPEKQPDILAAWENAVAQKLYEGVKDVRGMRIERAYAASNQLEYFAELTCAYFFSGEYEPFDQAALRDRDPQGFAMIEKMWGIRESPPAPGQQSPH